MAYYNCHYCYCCCCSDTEHSYWIITIASATTVDIIIAESTIANTIVVVYCIQAGSIVYTFLSTINSNPIEGAVRIVFNLAFVFDNYNCNC
jgi:hypothetical protein